MIREYIETVLRPQGAWVKKHWKGYLVFTTICFALGAILPTIYYKIEERKEQRESKKGGES